MLQEQMMKDVLISPYKLDLMSTFSLRPPELLFVDSPKIYLSCFHHEDQIKNCPKAREFVEMNLTYDMFQCMWINGANQQVRVRVEALDIILNLPKCIGTVRKLFYNLKRLVQGRNPLFKTLLLDDDIPFLDEENLNNLHKFMSSPTESLRNKPYLCNWQEHHYAIILQRFLKNKDAEYNKVGLPIPVFYPTKPSNYTKFLIHIVLSMGEFISEADLYTAAGSSVQLLKNANLISNDDPSMEDVINLTRRYILEQLIFLPKGTFLLIPI